MAAGAPRLRFVTGGPGTGKTTQVAALLADFLARWQGARGRASRSAAPTGKAASRLAESVRESLAAQVERGTLAPGARRAGADRGRTLHRLLGWQRDGFRHGREHPLPQQLVVVDEASMIDLALMCRLVEAVAPDAQLVIVGDPDQLPSVDTGDVLAALCEASEQPASPLARGARQHLQHPHRQRPEVEVDRLARWCAMARPRRCCTDSTRRLPRRELAARQRGGAAGLLREQAVPAYRALAEAASVEDALLAAREYRVLCALREGPPARRR
jgi:exodeoxyribonuclease V alpha subunit